MSRSGLFYSYIYKCKPEVKTNVPIMNSSTDALKKELIVSLWVHSKPGRSRVWSLNTEKSPHWKFLLVKVEYLFRNWTFYIQCCLLYSTLLQQSSKIQHWKLDLKLVPSFPVKFCFNHLIRFEVLKSKNMQQLVLLTSMCQYVKDHVYCLSNSVWFLLRLLQPKSCGFWHAGPIISP